MLNRSMSFEWLGAGIPVEHIHLEDVLEELPQDMKQHIEELLIQQDSENPYD